MLLKVSESVNLTMSNLHKRGCSSNGRALALHARGTGFDPPHLHSNHGFSGFFFSLEKNLQRIHVNWRFTQVKNIILVHV